MYEERYDPESNMIDWTGDFYYEMSVTGSEELAPGLKYTAYQWTNVPRKMHVLEIDLTSPDIELTTSMADDIVPNPNANGNSNDGFNIRETLSQLCTRKRTEGENVLAGINTGFFDSNDGIPRGLHIEDGEPVYVNNQGVRSGFVNHAWAFTVFSDATASCGKKEFKGTFEAAGKEYGEILEAGKKLGFIEADPAMDIDGFDAAAKVTALLNVLMNAGITPADVDRTGIGDITAEDIRKAAERGKVIKLLCEGRRTENGIAARVKPVEVDQSDMLASIDSTTSVVSITTDLMGKLSVIEHQPDLRQTAYGIFGDVIRLLDGQQR